VTREWKGPAPDGAGPFHIAGQPSTLLAPTSGREAPSNVNVCRGAFGQLLAGIAPAPLPWKVTYGAIS
jgi:hypothetical protein